MSDHLKIFTKKNTKTFAGMFFMACFVAIFLEVLFDLIKVDLVELLISQFAAIVILFLLVVGTKKGLREKANLLIG